MTLTGTEMQKARYVAYQNEADSQIVNRRRVPRVRCWAVIEEDGSEDGRLVASHMTQQDAERVASLLNASSGKA